MATFAVLQVAVLGGFPSGRTPGIEEIGLHYGVREDLALRPPASRFFVRVMILALAY